MKTERNILPQILVKHEESVFHLHRGERCSNIFFLKTE